MREEIANLVYPVLKDGLRVKEQLDRGERLDLHATQTRFNQLLKGGNEARQWPSYGGNGDEFLGIRYALACWLDEVFCGHPSEWGRLWNNSKRETALYNTNHRHWKFWEQARLAEARADKDALEAFYLCVMLGFRGELGEEPEDDQSKKVEKLQKLAAWRESLERQFSEGQSQTWPGPPELPPPPPNVPPLQARERFRRLVTAGVAVVGVAILIVMFFVIGGAF